MEKIHSELLRFRLVSGADRGTPGEEKHSAELDEAEYRRRSGRGRGG